MLGNYNDYPILKQAKDINRRYIPCSAKGLPLIKWSNGCMYKRNAKAIFGTEYLAENLKGTPYIIVDIDGDHDGIDKKLLEVFKPWWDNNFTHTLTKPYDDYPTSYHSHLKQTERYLQCISLTYM